MLDFIFGSFFMTFTVFVITVTEIIYLFSLSTQLFCMTFSSRRISARCSLSRRLGNNFSTRSTSDVKPSCLKSDGTGFFLDSGHWTTWGTIPACTVPLVWWDEKLVAVTALRLAATHWRTSIVSLDLSDIDRCLFLQLQLVVLLLSSMPRWRVWRLMTLLVFLVMSIWVVIRTREKPSGDVWKRLLKSRVGDSDFNEPTLARLICLLLSCTAAGPCFLFCGGEQWPWRVMGACHYSTFHSQYLRKWSSTSTR